MVLTIAGTDASEGVNPPQWQMQIICPLLLATSWSLTDKDWLNPQSMSFNILYKSLLLIHKALVWFSPLWSLRDAQGCLKGKEVFAGRAVTAPELPPASPLQFAEAADFIYCLLIFLKFIIPSLTCCLSFSYENSWVLVMPCSSVLQPHSFTSAGKWRDGALGQEEALGIALFWDQTSPVWEPFPIPRGWDLPSCRSALAGVGSKPGGRHWVGSGASVAVQLPVQQVRPSLTVVPVWRTVLCHSGAFSSGKPLGWVVRKGNVGLCRELHALSKPLPLSSLCKSLGKSDFYPQWNPVWCCSTPVFVPWEEAITWSISVCPTLCEHKADPSLLHWTFVKHSRSCMGNTAEYFGCTSLVTGKAQCKCLFWENLEGAMSLYWRLRGFDFFFLFRETCLF